MTLWYYAADEGIGVVRKSCQLMHEELCGADNCSCFGIVVVVQN